MSEPYVPTFSPRARTVAYLVAGLFLPVLTALTCTLLTIFEVLEPTVAAGIVGAVSLACATIAGGLGVAYRPTRNGISPSGAPVTDTPGRHEA